MKPLPHHYEIELAGVPTGPAIISAPGLPALLTAPPVEYDGPGDAWSPEHLLLAAVASCFLFSLRAVALASSLDFSSLDLAVAGTVDREAGVVRFTEITLRPRIVLPPGADRDRAMRVLAKSERACLVSSSLAVPLRLEPTVLGA